MYALTRILNWGGLASVALGGLLSLVGLAKGKEARQLESVTQVTSLAGAVTGYVLPMTPGGALAEQAALPLQRSSPSWRWRHCWWPSAAAYGPTSR